MNWTCGGWVGNIETLINIITAHVCEGCPSSHNSVGIYFWPAALPFWGLEPIMGWVPISGSAHHQQAACSNTRSICSTISSLLHLILITASFAPASSCYSSWQAEWGGGDRRMVGRVESCTRVNVGGEAGNLESSPASLSFWQLQRGKGKSHKVHKQLPHRRSQRIQQYTSLDSA